MVGAKAYLGDVDNVSDFKRGYREARRGINDGFGKVVDKNRQAYEKNKTAVDLLSHALNDESRESDSFKKGKYLAAANAVMKYSAELGEPVQALEGARAYDRFDKNGKVPYSVTRKLRNSLNIYVNQDDVPAQTARKLRGGINNFIEERGVKNDLGSRVVSFIGVVGLCTAILFLSSNITGNVVGGVGVVSSNIFGLVGLFVAIGSLFVRVRT